MCQYFYIVSFVHYYLLFTNKEQPYKMNNNKDNNFYSSISHPPTQRPVLTSDTHIHSFDKPTPQHSTPKLIPCTGLSCNLNAFGYHRQRTEISPPAWLPKSCISRLSAVSLSEKPSAQTWATSHPSSWADQILT